MENKKFELETGFVCPKCGSKNVEHLVHLTYPAQDHFKCPNCGEHKDIWREKPPVVVAPF